ncbi:MAG: hypothetical protein JWO84_539 [Parcubacteria group bacterium]|nr:hypothetical protein [Parcubacteria group bacterium]
MRTTLAIILALVSPLVFPAALTLVVVLIASVLVPPVGLLAGVLTDALYWTPSVSVPYATIAGLCASVLGYAVHQFIKTRIITG